MSWVNGCLRNPAFYCTVLSGITNDLFCPHSSFFFSFFTRIVTRLITVASLNFIPVWAFTCHRHVKNLYRCHLQSWLVGVLWLLFFKNRTVSVCPDPKGFLPLCQGASASMGHTTQLGQWSSEPYLPLCCNTRHCFSIQAIQWLSVWEASLSGLWAR